jgi:hypothetical protein
LPEAIGDSTRARASAALAIGPAGECAGRVSRFFTLIVGGSRRADVPEGSGGTGRAPAAEFAAYNIRVNLEPHGALSCKSA